MSRTTQPRIRRLRSDADLDLALPVMRELRPRLTTATAFRATVRRLERTVGYRLVGAWEAGVLVALAGFRVAESIAWGRHLYVDDLVTLPGRRSKGLGLALCRWLRAEGRKQRCVQWHLDSGTQRLAAHRFYLRERMDITCFHFQADL